MPRYPLRVSSRPSGFCCVLERWRPADRLGVFEQSAFHERVRLALAAAWGIQFLTTVLAQNDAVPALERRAFTEWARDGIWESLVANCEPTSDGVTQIERDFREILRSSPWWWCSGW